MQVDWIPVSERTPDTPRFVWACPFWTPQRVAFASWKTGNWWVGWQCLKLPSFTRWAEIDWPEPPKAEAADASEA